MREFKIGDRVKIFATKEQLKADGISQIAFEEKHRVGFITDMFEDNNREVWLSVNCWWVRKEYIALVTKEEISHYYVLKHKDGWYERDYCGAISGNVLEFSTIEEAAKAREKLQHYSSAGNNYTIKRWTITEEDV